MFLSILRRQELLAPVCNYCPEDPEHIDSPWDPDDPQDPYYPEVLEYIQNDKICPSGFFEGDSSDYISAKNPNSKDKTQYTTEKLIKFAIQR